MLLGNVKPNLISSKLRCESVVFSISVLSMLISCKIVRLPCTLPTNIVIFSYGYCKKQKRLFLLHVRLPPKTLKHLLTERFTSHCFDPLPPTQDCSSKYFPTTFMLWEQKATAQNNVLWPISMLHTRTRHFYSSFLSFPYDWQKLQKLQKVSDYKMSWEQSVD